MRLKDKIAIVTGTGTGMGRAIAIRFAREGAHVVGADINEAAGRDTAAEVNSHDRRGVFIKTDMGDVQDIDAMVSETISTFGQIDILVNNAGVTKSLGFFDVTEEAWDWIHAVNSKGVFFCMQAVAREMAKRKEGKIINIASIAGKGFRGTSNISYAGSKGSVIAITRVGASQLAKHNINVNSICPGATRTDLYQNVMKQITERQGISEQQARERLDSSIPLKRSNSPDDIANMAVFLGSNEAMNVTGQSFNVDGGLMWD